MKALLLLCLVLLLAGCAREQRYEFSHAGPQGLWLVKCDRRTGRAWRAPILAGEWEEIGVSTSDANRAK